MTRPLALSSWSPGRSCLSALMVALLVNAACTTPHGQAPPRGQPSSRSFSSTPPQATPATVDEGAVRLEPFGDGYWRLVVVDRPFRPPSTSFTRAEALSLLDSLHAGEGTSSLFGSTVVRAGFFDSGAPPGPPPSWAYRMHADLAARFGASLLPPVEELADSRLRLALKYSIRFMPQGAADAALALFTDPAFYFGLVTGLALYIGAWLLPEPIFSKATAIALTWALLLAFAVNEIRLAAGALYDLYKASRTAESAEALVAAAEQFGRAASGTAVRILAMIASRYAAKALTQVPEGGFRSLTFKPLATADGALLGGQIVVTTATVVADGSVVLSGAAMGSALASFRGGGGSLCSQERRPGYQEHHIATVANPISPRTGGPWTPVFEKLFARAGLSMESGANKMFLKGHWGPHPEQYHQEVFRSIRDRLGRCASPSACGPLLEAALRDLATEICTPGSMLNLLIARP